MSSMKCFTKGTLREANLIAIRRNYNRQLEPAFIESLPDDKLFPAFFVLPHEHAAGKKIEMHYRCWIAFDGNGSKGFVDCDARLFNSLIEVNLPDRKEAQ